MSIFTELFFVNTAEDQENYFTGEHRDFNNNIFQSPNMISGNYRIIDGELFQIISALSPDDILARFRGVEKNTQ